MSGWVRVVLLMLGLKSEIPCFLLTTMKYIEEQAGAELGQAQNKIGLLGKLMLSSSIEVVLHRFHLPLRLSSIDVVFH